MKKLWTFFILAILLSVNIFSQTVEIGTGVTTSYFYGPMYRSSASSSFDYSRYSMLYTATDLASVPAGAQITQVEWYKDNAFATTGGAIFEIFMKTGAGASTQTSGATWGTLNSGSTQVYASTSQTFTTATGWIAFPLSAPFIYDGTGLQILTLWNIAGVAGSPSTGSFLWRYSSGLTGNMTLGAANSTVMNDLTTLATGSYGGTLRPNIRITYTGGAACSGTPSPGNTLASVTSACPSTTFTLSLQNLTSGSGVSYQWQNSTNGVSFSDITGATFGSYSASQTVATWYRCNVTCSGSTGTSTPVQVNMNPVTSCYCPSIPSNAADEEIYSVTVNGATNAYNCTTVAPGTGSILNRYSNFYPLGSLTTLSQGTTVSFTILEDECDGATYYANGCAIWIDWNQNGSFADAGEQVYVEATTTISPRTISGSFLVPLTALSGQTGMRIIVSEGSSGAGLTPCMSYSYGETEDYLVSIGAPPSCLPPSNLTATNISGFAAKLGWTEMGTSTSWELEWGSQGFAQGTGTVVTVNTNNFYQLNGLIPSTNYAFYVRTNCGANGYSTWSGPKTFSTTVACPAPTALTAYNITTTGARVQYTSPGNLFKVEYGIYGFTQGTGTVITGIVDTAYNLTGLTHSSRYSYYVQQDCGTNGTSLWAGPYSFYTLCDIISTFPFTENFTSGVPPTTCWTKYSGTLADPSVLTINAGSFFSKNYLNVSSPANPSAAMNIWSINTGWLVTPQINLGTGSVNYTLEFDMGLTAYGTANGAPATTGTDDKFAVVISTDGGTTWSSVNTLRLWDNAGSSYVYNSIPPTGEHISINLAGYTGVVKFAFYGESSVSNADNDLFVDNVKVMPPVTCISPTNLSSINISAFQGTARWVGTTNASVQYGTQGFVLGSGTIINNITDTFKILSGLNPSTAYSFYVQKDCGGGDLSFWEGPVNFTTTSANVTNPSPANLAIDVQINNDSLKWTAMPGALGYRINVGTTLGAKDLADSLLCVNNFFVHPANWNFNQTIYWKVFTVYQSGVVEAASTGSSFSFTTTNGNVITPSPANFATNIPVNKDTLAWASIVGATGYRINIGTTSGGKELVDSAYASSNFYKYLGGNFNFNQTIYWKVFTIINTGGVETATSGSSFSFTTTNGKAVNPVPANNSINIAKTATLLNWDDVVGSAGYYILVGTTSGGKDVVDSVYCANSEYTSTLDWLSGTIYYWRVYTVIPGGTAQGDIWNFTTQCDPYMLPYSTDFATGTCWTQTISGAAGITNRWSIAASSNAGGTSPEATCTWQNYIGTARLISPGFLTAGLTSLRVIFKQMYNDYGAGATLKLKSSADGINWTDESFTYATGSGSIAARTDTVYVANNLGNVTFIAWEVDGNLYQINYWYIDDVKFENPVTNKQLNLTLFLQGLYNGTNMNEAQDDMGSHWGTGIADHIDVELRNGTTSALEQAFTGQVLNTDGTCTVTVPSSMGDSYYIAIKHRNSVQTWTALPISFGGTAINYNFTTAATMAFADNMKEVATGVYALYVGDVNQDEVIDLSDLVDMDTDLTNGTVAYVVYDLNGDGVVDLSDLVAIDENLTNGVVSMYP
jgi:hypothetical protein